MYTLISSLAKHDIVFFDHVYIVFLFKNTRSVIYPVYHKKALFGILPSYSYTFSTMWN